MRRYALIFDLRHVATADEIVEADIVEFGEFHGVVQRERALAALVLAVLRLVTVQVGGDAALGVIRVLAQVAYAQFHVISPV